MAIDSVADGDTVLAADVNQYKEALEGTRTVSYSLASAASTSFVVKLADNAGARKVSITDSDGVEVASIDSNGNATFGGITLTSFTLPTSASPTQTEEASVVWDTTNNWPTYGDGSENRDFPAGPIIKVKTADETVNNSATLQDDDHLVFAAVANAKYWVRITLYISSGAVPDFKSAFSVPSGTTGWRGMVTNSAAGFVQNADLTTGRVSAMNAANYGAVIEAYVETSSTAGNVTFQWAQDTADASNTTVAKGSTMMVWRLD